MGDMPIPSEAPWSKLVKLSSKTCPIWGRFYHNSNPPTHQYNHAEALRQGSSDANLALSPLPPEEPTKKGGAHSLLPL